ncbi:MAG: hypothetical protein IPL79_03580 [Myxococcales bacterium]|nr:hypothetical protein [Myxococcales bacterium]
MRLGLCLAFSILASCLDIQEDAGPVLDSDAYGSDDEAKSASVPRVLCVDAATPDAAARNEACKISTTLGRAVRKFVTANPRLYELAAGHRDFSTTEGFNEHVYETDLPFRASEFIEALATMSPEALWASSSEYRLGFNRQTGVLSQPGEAPPRIATGMVFVLRLRIAPLIYLPVAFEIVEMDAAAGRFAFSYVTQNKTQGIQRVTVSDRGAGAHIKHETRFKSDSEFRDDYFYVPFHEKLVREFYEAVAAYLIEYP